jgi:hypothetical protein
MLQIILAGFSDAKISLLVGDKADYPGNYKNGDYHQWQNERQKFSAKFQFIEE